MTKVREYKLASLIYIVAAIIGFAYVPFHNDLFMRIIMTAGGIYSVIMAVYYFRKQVY
jgi:hypothetical protein